MAYQNQYPKNEASLSNSIEKYMYKAESLYHKI